MSRTITILGLVATIAAITGAVIYVQHWSVVNREDSAPQAISQPIQPDPKPEDELLKEKLAGIGSIRNLKPVPLDKPQ
jgi:hypothetical protein